MDSLFVVGVFSIKHSFRNGFYHEVGNRHLVQIRARGIFNILKQHTELGSPIPNVVERQVVYPSPLQHFAKAVANNRRAKMTNVHLFGYVG